MKSVELEPNSGGRVGTRFLVRPVSGGSLTSVTHTEETGETVTRVPGDRSTGVKVRVDTHVSLSQV